MQDKIILVKDDKVLLFKFKNKVCLPTFLGNFTFGYCGNDGGMKNIKEYFNVEGFALGASWGRRIVSGVYYSLIHVESGEVKFSEKFLQSCEDFSNATIVWGNASDLTLQDDIDTVTDELFIYFKRRSNNRFFVDTYDTYRTNCTHEFKIGGPKGDHWNKTSLFLDDDVMTKDLVNLLESTVNFAYFGITKTTKEDWLRLEKNVGGCNFATRTIFFELFDWAMQIFTFNEMITILGV